MLTTNGSLLDRATRSRKRFTSALKHGRRGIPLVLSGLLLAGATPPVNLQEALEAQRSLVAQDPSDADQLNDLGNLLALARDLEGAEETYRRALTLEPDSPTTLYNLALVLQERGKIKQARQTYQSILATNPDHAWGHYQLATLYSAQNNRSKALVHYERAFALDRSLADPRVNPHIVENRLVTDALLQLYVTQSPSTQAPRLYREPGDVAELLLPAQPDQSFQDDMAAQQAAEAADRSRRQYRASFQAQPEVRQAAEPAIEEDAGYQEVESPQDTDFDVTPGTSFGADSSFRSAPGWSGTATTLQPGTTPGSTFEQETPPAAVVSPPAGVITQPTVRRITEEDLRSTGTESPTPPGPFTPGTQSTGRLEIELVPAPDSSTTVPAS